MDRAAAIEHLARHADALKGMGATALYLFGSVARDDAAAASDIDIVIDYRSGSGFTLLDLVGMKQYLEDALPVPVDITTRDSLNPIIRGDIERTALRVF